jgi:hypothetical protein
MTLGTSPTSININEVYSTLQTRIVEGQENPLSLIRRFKFYGGQKFVFLTNRVKDGFWTLVNALACHVHGRGNRPWSRLPRLFRLDTGRANYLCPFLGIVDDERAEISG